MTTLAEFLQNEGKEILARVSAAEQTRREWVASLGRLMEQIRTWLADADPEGVLKVTPQEFEVGEEKYGRYKAPGLVLDLGARRVEVRPGMRNPTNHPGKESYKERIAEGAAEIRRGYATFRLYRKLDGQGERWLIADPDERVAKPFDRAALEEAVVRLLQ